MNPITIGRELASACALVASYPLECLTFLQIPRSLRRSRDAVILIHGNGGDRTNMLALSLLVRMTGFDNIGFFSYSMRQSVEASALQLTEMAAQADGGAGVHFVGHSLGGTIARRAAARSENGRLAWQCKNPETTKSPAERVRRAVKERYSEERIYLASALPILIRLSAITPSPTHRFMPAAFL